MGCDSLIVGHQCEVSLDSCMEGGGGRRGGGGGGGGYAGVDLVDDVHGVVRVVIWW